MRIYSDKTVYQAAVERVSFIFDNFDDVVVTTSGGKDSTVIFNLCMMEAEKRNRLPLKVMFIDQEAEWESTISYVKSIMYDKRVEPYWLQIPIRLFNATSHESDNWLHCWNEDERNKWIRPKDPIAITENIYGTDRFAELFSAFLKKTFGDRKSVCYVSGVRAEESPARLMTLTNNAFYKHITWGNKKGNTLTFYPIYDWSYTDVWHAIAVNRWKYNKVYDEFYRYGVAPTDMRVSNLNHETAVRNLYMVQEIEPRLWEKIVERMNGINTTSKIDYKDNFQAVKELPFMFRSWKEYRDYLVEYLITDEAQRDIYRKRFAKEDRDFCGDNSIYEKLLKTEISCLLANDYTFTKLHNFTISSKAVSIRKIRKGKRVKGNKKELEILEEINAIGNRKNSQ